jgi:hypothetical protein
MEVGWSTARRGTTKNPAPSYSAPATSKSTTKIDIIGSIRPNTISNAAPGSTAPVGDPAAASANR